MRIRKFLLILLSSPCFGEVFYYSDHYVTVDLRSDQPSILKFEKVPLSSSCQPGILRFEPLDQKSLNLGEQQHVQEVTPGENEKDSTVSQLLRVTPQENEGIVTCAFTLAGGSEVPVRFNLTAGISRPLVELRPLMEKFSSPQLNNDLGLLQSLVKGDSVYLHDITKELDLCSTRGRSGACRHFHVSTDLAEYEFTYVGTDMNVKAWTLDITTKTLVSFTQIADLNAKHGSNILYSTVAPQKQRYEKGEKLRHFILSNAQVTQLDIKEVLP